MHSHPNERVPYSVSFESPRGVSAKIQAFTVVAPRTIRKKSNKTPLTTKQQHAFTLHNNKNRIDRICAHVILIENQQTCSTFVSSVFLPAIGSNYSAETGMTVSQPPMISKDITLYPIECNRTQSLILFQLIRCTHLRQEHFTVVYGDNDVSTAHLQEHMSIFIIFSTMPAHKIRNSSIQCGANGEKPSHVFSTLVTYSP